MSRARVSLPLLALIVSLLQLTACESEPDTADDTNGETGDGDGDGDAGDGDGDGDGGDGDGDGDAGDGDGDTTGSGDPTCDAFADATPVQLIAAASAAEAATASIVPDGATLYQVTLPEGAAGFVELQIPDWDTVQVFFTTADIEYTVTVNDNSQVEMPRTAVESCPDAGITTQGYGFPHWTPATIEFGATGPREIPLMVVQQ